MAAAGKDDNLFWSASQILLVLKRTHLYPFSIIANIAPRVSMMTQGPGRVSVKQISRPIMILFLVDPLRCSD